MDALKKQIYAEYELYRESKMTPVALEAWLIDLVAQLRSEKRALYDLAWEQHLNWMASLMNLAQERGLSSEDVSKAMTEEDRKSNREFISFMTENQNPHMRGAKFELWDYLRKFVDELPAEVKFVTDGYDLADGSYAQRRFLLDDGQGHSYQITIMKPE